MKANNSIECDVVKATDGVNDAVHAGRSAIFKYCDANINKIRYSKLSYTIRILKSIEIQGLLSERKEIELSNIL